MFKILISIGVIAAGYFASLSHAAVNAPGVTRQQALDFGAPYVGSALSFKILVPGVGTGQRNASAAFLNRRYALTSAHNITDLLQYNPTYEVADGPNYQTNRGNVMRVTRVIFHPSIDLALLEFASDFMPVADKTVGVVDTGDIVISAGFGQWGTGDTGIISPRDGGLGGWDAQVQSYDICNYGAEYQTTRFDSSDLSGLALNGHGASGDSGSPVFNLAGELVGINDCATVNPINFIFGATSYVAIGEPSVKAWIITNSKIPDPPKIALNLTSTSAQLAFSNLIAAREYRIMRSTTLGAWEEAHRFNAAAATDTWGESLAIGGIMFYRLEWNE